MHNRGNAQFLSLKDNLEHFNENHWSNLFHGISDPVVEYIVAIDVIRVRFLADARHAGMLCNSLAVKIQLRDSILLAPQEQKKRHSIVPVLGFHFFGAC